MSDKAKLLLLIMNGHDSYESDMVKAVAYHLLNGENPIELVLLCFPSKCTHKMQPLDVGIFHITSQK